MRKSLLVKPKLQFLHLSWILLVVVIASVSGYILFESILGEAVQKELIPWQTLRLGGGVILLILMVALGMENYFFFHRIVGPLYALEKGIKRLAEGDFNHEVRVRESDEFKELIAGFEEVKKQLQHRFEIHDQTVRLLTQELDKVLANTTKESIGTLQAKLKEIREQVVKKAA